MKAKFNYPTRIVFGEGTLQELPGKVKRLGGRKPMVVTDTGLMRTDIVRRVTDLLRKDDLEAEVFSDVEPNPTDAQVDEGAEAFRSSGSDCIVAVGGGSPLDAAKAIQVRVLHTEPIEEYDDMKGGGALITGPLPPLVAVPTTSGTGSEVSRAAVITVKAVGRKLIIFSPRLMPSVAVCDPKLTYGLPPRVTAETGMDALSHNLEAFLAVGYHPMADGIALQGIRMVGKNLRAAVQDGRNVNARREMMAASMMGAVAFQKGLGVIHSAAHALGAVTNIGHGLANAILMPHAVRFNAEAAPDRIAEVASALGAADTSGEGAAAAVARLLEDIGLPPRLSDAGVKEEHLSVLTEKAMADGCHTQNPRSVKAADMEALLRAAF
jgi:alcohol dehydrogenase class IV